MKCKRASEAERKALAQGIRGWRKIQKLSQRDCAALLDSSVRYVQMLENNCRTPSGDFIIILIKATKPGSCCPLGECLCPMRRRNRRGCGSGNGRR